MKKIMNTFGSRMCFILLFISGTIPAALSGPSLDCTNDFIELMNCQFEAQKCSEYNLTLQNNDGPTRKECVFQKCDTGLCCCSIQMELFYRESYNADVWKGNKSVESKNFNIKGSIKPKAPTLISVNESNGNFQLKWKTNMKGSFRTKPAANVTYYKKGDTTKVCKTVEPSIDGELEYYEIPGQHLEPSTTYVVSVRSYTNWSGKYSDSSEEREFTTAASSHTLSLGIIVSLSTAAVIITGAAFGCYYKVRAKWLDTVAKCPKPKLLDLHPGTQKGRPPCNILKPLPTDFSCVSVDPAVPNNSNPWSPGSLTDSGSPEQSNEISAGTFSHSCVDVKPVNIKARVQDSLSKTFAEIIPLTSVTVSQLSEDSGLFSAPNNPSGAKADDSNSPGSTNFDNRVYFSSIPSCPRPIMTESSEVHAQAEMICDSAHHPSEGDPVTCAQQQLQVSSPMPVDMSYHQCSTNSANAADSN